MQKLLTNCYPSYHHLRKYRRGFYYLHCAVRWVSMFKNRVFSQSSSWIILMFAKGLLSSYSFNSQRPEFEFPSTFLQDVDIFFFICLHQCSKKKQRELLWPVGVTRHFPSFFMVFYIYQRYREVSIQFSDMSGLSALLHLTNRVFSSRYLA